MLWFGFGPCGCLFTVVIVYFASRHGLCSIIRMVFFFTLRMTTSVCVCTEYQSRDDVENRYTTTAVLATVWCRRETLSLRRRDLTFLGVLAAGKISKARRGEARY